MSRYIARLGQRAEGAERTPEEQDCCHRKLRGDCEGDARKLLLRQFEPRPVCEAQIAGQARYGLAQ